MEDQIAQGLNINSRRVQVWRRRRDNSSPTATVERSWVRQHGIMVKDATACDSRSPLDIITSRTAQRNMDDVQQPVALSYI